MDVARVLHTKKAKAKCKITHKWHRCIFTLCKVFMEKQSWMCSTKSSVFITPPCGVVRFMYCPDSSHAVHDPGCSSALYTLLCSIMMESVYFLKYKVLCSTSFSPDFHLTFRLLSFRLHRDKTGRLGWSLKVIWYWVFLLHIFNPRQQAGCPCQTVSW